MEKTKINLKEIRKIQLDILNAVTNYCDEHDITYFLGYGTLLGAARHKGYIPWDDDIDITMPRKDYEKFIRNYHSDIYEVRTHIEYSDYPARIAKVINKQTILIENIDKKYSIGGVNIDIFPLDQFPKSQKKVRKLYRKIKFKTNLLTVKVLSVNPDRKWYKNLVLQILKIILMPLSARTIIKSIHKTAMTYKDKEKNQLMGCIVQSHSIKDIMERSVFKNKIRIQFEENMYYAPRQYQKYLTNMYGDYMAMPPEEKRITHHDFEAYLLKEK